jgi:hypothetical protein
MALLMLMSLSDTSEMFPRITHLTVYCIGWFWYGVAVLATTLTDIALPSTLDAVWSVPRFASADCAADTGSAQKSQRATTPKGAFIKEAPLASGRFRDLRS